MQNRNIFGEVLQDYIGKQDSCESLKAMREDGFTEVHMVFTVPQLENHSICKDFWINYFSCAILCCFLYQFHHPGLRSTPIPKIPK